MTINIVEKRNIWFVISGVLVLGSILIVGILGLRLGIDFTGGSLLEVEFDQIPVVSEVRATLSTVGYTDVSIQTTGEQGLIIRTTDLTEAEHQAILDALSASSEGVKEMRFDSIGSVIGKELRRTALIGVAITLLLIGFYIAWAFRKVSEPVASWKYGLLTIIAAFHDVIITLGAFSLLGYFFGWEIGTAFVAAILTVLGYSINDTIVVFDRTRENLFRRAADTFDATVEMSIKQTLMRSLNTSLTTILALVAIFLFGGDSTRSFALALIIGITAGTYSSIFLASPALVEWELRKQ